MPIDATTQAGCILLVVNPRSGAPRSRRVRRLLAVLSPAADRVRLVRTCGMDHARRAALEAPRDTSLIVVAGGDGTVNEVLPAAVVRDIPLAVVPLGTSNLLARAVGIPRDIEAACRIAVAGKTRRLDVGRVGRERFAAVGGAGFDAAVIHAFAACRDGHSNLACYVGPVLRTVASYPFRRFTVECDGRLIMDGATDVIVSNTPTYGGPAAPAPRARPDDGLLDVCVFAAPGRVRYMGCTLASVFQGHTLLPGTRVLRARKVSCFGAEGVPVQLDGDARGMLPATFEVEPGALKLAVP